MQIHLFAAAISVAAAALVACAPAPLNLAAGAQPDIAALADADAVLLGEQHDAADHQRIEREVVSALAARGTLGALAMEMAEEGRSTQNLKPGATEAQVQQALAWDSRAWPWAAYGPVAMAAVRAGVPVLGANLPRARMKDAMADVSLDVQLPGPALKAQQQAIRIGHCDQLPESQISPMTRIQVARDRAMAHTVAQAVVRGKTVVLVSGAGHADRTLGVPQHLPTDLKVRSVKLQAGENAGGAAGETSAGRSAPFDLVWLTPALPAKDYCAGLRRAS